MKKQPLISIVTPVYNRETLIVECIKSVQNQEYKNYEHIIIDDCSTDNTLATIKALAEKDDRIVIAESVEKSDGRPGKVRNIGIKMAKGELIAFLDSDDLWEKEKLSTQLEFMQKNDFDFSYHPLSRLVNNSNPAISFWGRDCFQKDFFRGLFLSNFIPTCSVLVKKKVLEEVGFFDESLKYSEDYFLWLLIALKKYQIGFLSDVLGCFRRTNHGNINSVLDKKEKHENDIFLKEKILFEHKNESIPRLMKSDLFYKYIYYYYELIKTEASSARKKELLDKVITRIFELNLTLFFITELEFLARLRKND
jgi:glycosyltransferase involved in cell wall biosynthesis